MQDRDDEVLVQQAQAGDRQAFAVLVQRWWERVFRWLYGLTRHASLAEDLTQETFLRSWRAIRTFRSESRFRPWLFSIARNCWIDNRRGPRGLAGKALPASLAGREPAPDEAVVAREGEHLLAEACARLPEHFREAFLLWAQNDLSFAELAGILGLTEETARWRVFKARLLLVRQLGNYLDRNRR